MADLLPCPFCGGQASMDQDEGRRGTSRQSCIVVCTYCGCKLECNEEGEMCGNDWNRRAQLAPPEPLPEDVEAMARELHDIWIHKSVTPCLSIARLILSDRQRAVEAERQACAALAEAFADGRRDYGATIPNEVLKQREIASAVDCRSLATRIRARGAAQDPQA